MTRTKVLRCIKKICCCQFEIPDRFFIKICYLKLVSVSLDKCFNLVIHLIFHFISFTSKSFNKQWKSSERILWFAVSQVTRLKKIKSFSTINDWSGWTDLNYKCAEVKKRSVFGLFYRPFFSLLCFEINILNEIICIWT